METMTLKYAEEVIENLMGGTGPDNSDAYAYDLEIALPMIKDWLIMRMNQNFIHWSGETISADTYEDTMIRYSDLASKISEYSGHWDYWAERFLVRPRAEFKPEYTQQ